MYLASSRLLGIDLLLDYLLLFGVQLVLQNLLLFDVQLVLHLNFPFSRRSIQLASEALFVGLQPEGNMKKEIEKLNRTTV